VAHTEPKAGEGGSDLEEAFGCVPADGASRVLANEAWPTVHGECDVTEILVLGFWYLKGGVACACITHRMQEPPDFVTTVMDNRDPRFVKETMAWLSACIRRQHPVLPACDNELLELFDKKPPPRDIYLWIFLLCLCFVKEVRERALAECVRHRIDPFLLQLNTEFSVCFLGKHSFCQEVDDNHKLKYEGIDQFVRKMQVSYAARFDPHGLFADHAAKSSQIPAPH